MVNFRLSEEEYEKLRTFCLSNGSRSLSDFARVAVTRMAGLDEAPAEPAGPWARKIEGKVEELGCELKRLAELVHGGSSFGPDKGVRKAS